MQASGGGADGNFRSGLASANGEQFAALVSAFALAGQRNARGPPGSPPQHVVAGGLPAPQAQEVDVV